MLCDGLALDLLKLAAGFAAKPGICAHIVGQIVTAAAAIPVPPHQAFQNGNRACFSVPAVAGPKIRMIAGAGASWVAIDNPEGVRLGSGHLDPFDLLRTQSRVSALISKDSMF